MSSDRLATMPITRLLIHISIPIILSSLIQALYNIVDGIYVSQLSENALTATSLSFSIQMLMVALISGLSVGMNALLSRRLGEKQRDAANAIAASGVWIAVFASLLFVAFGLFLAAPFFRLLTDDPEIIALGVDYLSACTVFCLPMAIGTMAERVLVATGKTLYSMSAHIAGMVVNIILDPIMIFGYYGFPEMGIRGAAVATVLGQLAACMLSVALNLWKNKEVRLLYRGFKLRGTVLWEIITVGFPVSVMQAIGTVMTFGINKVLLLFTPTAVAVFGIYYKLQMFVFMPIFAFGQGLITITGYNYGAKQSRRITDTVKYTLLFCVGIATLGLLAFQLLPGQLLSLFHPSAEMLQIGGHALRVISCIFPIEAICVTLSFAFQGLGLGKLSLFHSTIRQLVLRVPLAYLFAVTVGLDAVWYSMWIAEAGSLIITTLLYRRVCRTTIAPLQGPTTQENTE